MDYQALPQLLALPLSHIRGFNRQPKRVAEYWKKAYDNNSAKSRDLSYEPSAILGQTKKPGKRFSIYDISSLDLSN